MSRPTSTVSGLVSGMDWETTIQQLLAIERRRTNLLERRKDDNQTKLSLWAQIQSKLQTLQSAMEGMDQRSEFAVKSVSSSDSTIVEVTADASAAAGAHTLEVLQLAKAHRVAAQGWADKNLTGVGDSGGDLVIQVGDDTITIADADLSATTTLEQLVSLINGAAGNDNLVTASILDDGSGTNRYRLVLSSNSPGVDSAITISSNPTNLDFNGTQIDRAETAADWTGTSAITTAGAYAGTTNKTFTFTVGGVGTQTVGTGDITLNWVDSLGNTGSVIIPNGYAGGNIAVAEGVELSFAAGDLVAGQGFDVDVFQPELTAAQDARLRVDGVYLTSATNAVNGVLEGVTFDLLAAEPGTVVDVTIANDAAAVKEKIQGFVNAYNALIGDIALYSKYDAENEQAAPLLGDGFLAGIRSRLHNAAARAVAGLADDALYNSLAVVGVRASTGGQLSIDSVKLDAALEDHFEDVVNLFTTSFASTDSKIFYVSADEHTIPGEYSLEVSYDAAGALTSATINGQAATIDGELIRGAEDSDFEGLVLGFTSPGSGPGTVTATIRYSQGAAGVLAAEAKLLTDPETGTVHFAQENINNTLESLDRQIAAWDERLKAVEERLRRQFSQLETAISQMRSQSSYIASILG